MDVLISRLLSVCLLTVFILTAVLSVCTRMLSGSFMADMSGISMISMDTGTRDCAGSLQACPVSFFERLQFLSQITPPRSIDFLQLALGLMLLAFMAVSRRDHGPDPTPFKVRWKGQLFKLLHSCPKSGLFLALSQGIVHGKRYA